MNRNRVGLLLVALSLTLAACVSSQSADTTSAPPTEPTGGPTATSVGPNTTLDGRTYETFDCDDAPDEVAIVCEAYELIQVHYVDDIADSDLADAAQRAVESQTGQNNGELFVCALPTDGFEESCETAAEVELTSAEAAELVVAGLATYALDPNSAYFDEDALALLQEEQQGEIEGIGALVTPEDETIEGDNKQCTIVSDTCLILIVSTIEGAPAEAAGLQRDDAIVGVDGVSIDGWTIDEVTSQVRGPAGTNVVLTIDRAGDELEITITRAAVVIPVIDSERFGTTGYVQLRIFSDNADEQFEEAILDLLAKGIDALVIDLRDNPGGLLDTAIEIASVFLDDGDVVVTQSPDDQSSYEVTGDAIVPDDLKVVFVVNKGSASASEVVSAVLQERGRATVVGENTFGKNTVQQRFGLSNGGALKLTIARWLTPDGLDFGGVGVTPDISLEIDPGISTEALVETVLDAA
ncbi:MAG: S41 family peptidase [Actinomycetota bacterium]|nr:S41 family peptidase [Actinomycetota bacterium]